MKTLAIDTSSKFFSLALTDGEKLYEYHLETGRKLSALITVSIARVMQCVGWRPQDLDYLACGLGPGSFTGLRIGIATVKGLAWPLKKPVIGVSSLDILANGVRPGKDLIVPAVDAKRGLIYCSAYRFNRGALTRTLPYLLLSVEEFCRRIKPGSIILGDAAELYPRDFLKNIPGCRILERDYWYPQARNCLALARGLAVKGKFATALKLKPIYLYPKECQVAKLSQARS